MEEAGGFLNLLDFSATPLAVTVLVFVFVQMMRGKLLPESTVQKWLDSKDAELARERETSADWHAAHTTSEAAREIIDQQNRELVEVARTVEHVMESLGEAANRRRGTDARPDAS